MSFPVQTYLKTILDHLKFSFYEDVHDGDHTSLSCMDEHLTQQAQLLVKRDGIIAGIEVAELIVKHLSHTLSIDKKKEDGQYVQSGDIAFYLSGSAREIVTLERLMLNYMQRMSGIATQTHEYAQKLAPYKAKILDTRKTTPGFRIFEKWAVSIGGGHNHRFGLFDMIMIKDNHVDYAGGIKNAIQKANQYLAQKQKNIPIEIEVRNLQELEEVLNFGQVQRIMLDNFTVEQTRDAVSRINEKYEIESSGGITIDNIEAYAECGVDFISVGALTHQIKSLDLSLKAC